MDNTNESQEFDLDDILREFHEDPDDDVKDTASEEELDVDVLLVEEAGTAEKLFSATGMRVERIRPAAMPSGADGYLAYDEVVLNNIDYAAAAQKQWQALDQAVRTLGRGLLVLGGDTSYALGGYRGTDLEALLPVTIDVRNKQRMPALSLVICIDKSGSMTSGQFGASRIEAAKEVARNTRGPIASIYYQGLDRYDQGLHLSLIHI